MSKNDDRFVRIYKQGAMRVFEVFVDRETGVNYLFTSYGNAGGITPLLDKNRSRKNRSLADERARAPAKRARVLFASLFSANHFFCSEKNARIRIWAGTGVFRIAASINQGSRPPP